MVLPDVFSGDPRWFSFESERERESENDPVVPKKFPVSLILGHERRDWFFMFLGSHQTSVCYIYTFLLSDTWDGLAWVSVEPVAFGSWHSCSYIAAK